MFRSENVSDDDVVEKARDSLADVSIVPPFSLSRSSFHTECRVGGHRDTCGCRVRVVVRRGNPKSVDFVFLFSLCEFRKPHSIARGARVRRVTRVTPTPPTGGRRLRHVFPVGVFHETRGRQRSGVDQGGGG